MKWNKEEYQSESKNKFVACMLNLVFPIFHHAIARCGGDRLLFYFLKG
jgi:hypothetical protein